MHPSVTALPREVLKRGGDRAAFNADKIRSAIERAGVSVDAEGFHFVAASESNAIDAQEYGTAFTSEHFVRTQLATLAPKPARVGYWPTWFWMHQDAWVLERPLSVAGGAS